MDLAEKLVALRKKKGLTQKELAEQLDVSRQAVSRWEVGIAVPGMENLRAIGELYQVSVDFLLDDAVDEMPVSNKTESLEVLEKHSEDTPKNNYRKILIAAIACLFVIVIAAAIFSKFYRDTDAPTPISELDSEENEGYATEYFDIEW